MIKKIKIELLIIALLMVVISISHQINFSFNKNFYNLGFGSTNLYYKKFFIDITELGNSLWYFLISFLAFLIFYFFERKKGLIFFKKLKSASLLIFISILTTGIITQVLKHVVGRPRPNYADKTDFLGFNFFSLDSSFHSFPSGHASTIFVLALSLSVLTPKIKYFYLFFALIVGFSRVVVNAHYFSDIIGGFAVAFIGVKLSIYLLKKLNTDFLKIVVFDISLFFSSIVIFLISIIFITISSNLDILISGLFYIDNYNFFLQSYNYITILGREIFLPFVIFYILILPIICLWAPLNRVYFMYCFNIKKITFLWCSLFFNIFLVINLFLKNFWGRARPNEILEFGGENNFTPWFEISNACNTNCSFVSGDASVGFSLISLYFLTNNKKYIFIALVSGLSLGIIRIMEGGHFLSDVLIAGFLVFFLTYFQSMFFKRYLDD